MNAQLAIDFRPILPERDEGAERAIDHANRKESEWSGQALGFMIAFANEVMRPFFTEECRVWSYARGLTRPPDERAWGKVPQRGCAKKKLRKYDYQRAPGNSCAKPRWLSVNVPPGTTFKET